VRRILGPDDVHVSGAVHVPAWHTTALFQGCLAMLPSAHVHSAASEMRRRDAAPRACVLARTVRLAPPCASRVLTGAPARAGARLAAAAVVSSPFCPAASNARLSQAWSAPWCYNVGLTRLFLRQFCFAHRATLAAARSVPLDLDALASVRRPPPAARACLLEEEGAKGHARFTGVRL